MQNKSLIELAGNAVRATVCVKCYQRPVGSESLEPTVARQCEGQCTIFDYLPQLLAAAKRNEDLHPDELMQKTVCQSCDASMSAGDFCSERLTRVCPLSRYAGDIIQILGTLLERGPNRPKTESPC